MCIFQQGLFKVFSPRFVTLNNRSCAWKDRRAVDLFWEHLGVDGRPWPVEETAIVAAV